MHLNVYHIASINANTFVFFKKLYSSQNSKVTPVGGILSINNVAKIQRQSLMG